MIAVLLDQGLAPRAASFLRQRGIDAVHVSEIGMCEAQDMEILEAARNAHRICVTLDHDFHTHLALAGHGLPSVVLLRVESLGAEAQAELIEAICRQWYEALLEGAAISADGRSVRVRRLPLK
jgi:predicted nuclease of predicted toxin-antitoxin system